MTSIAELYEYKPVNLDIPQELQHMVVNSAKYGKQRKGSNWRKVDSKNRTNWMIEKKFNQDENERLYSSYRNILNKLSDSNIDELSKELVSLGIDTKEQLQKLVDTIFSKALNEKHFLKNYAIISKELASYFIEEADQKTYFRELLLNKCQMIFTEAITIDKEFELGGQPSTNFKFKEQVISCISFIGELYNHDLLTTRVVQNCFNWIFSKVDNKKAYIIDILCNFFETVAKKFCESSKEGASLVITKLEALKTTVSLKEKFAIMDLLDVLAKEKSI